MWRALTRRRRLRRTGALVARWPQHPSWATGASTSSLVAEVEMDEEPELGIRRDDRGIDALGRLDDGERVRVVVRGEHLGADR